jgi:hypothetical protein
MPLTSTLFNLEITLRAGLSVAASPGRCADPGKPVDVFVGMADHFEPQVERAPQRVARERLEDWLRRYPEIASRHRDADGRMPAHTFCYPWDEFDDWECERLAELCSEGFGEIEFHLHHRDDTDASLRKKLRDGCAAFRRYGALSEWGDGRPAFGFVHGNWSLDNSRCEHGQNFCGVNNELQVLQEEGCYADFTFPSWKKGSQPRTLNQVYYAVDDSRPKSYDRGQPARVGATDSRGLLMVPGPLVPYLRRGQGLPRLGMDDGDLASYWPYEPVRMDRWLRAGVQVAGRPDRIFVKLHCHGCADWGRFALLDQELDALFTDLEARFNDGKCYRLHYVTLRELFNVIKATEAGLETAPGECRDWLLPAPAASGAGAASSGRPLIARP